MTYGTEKPTRKRLVAVLAAMIAGTGSFAVPAAPLASAADAPQATIEVGLRALPNQSVPPSGPVWPTGPCRKSSTRSTTDRPDLHKGEQVHIVYVLAADMTDEGLDRNGVLQCSVLAWNQWFEEQSGGVSWQLDTFKQRRRNEPLVDITFIRSQQPSAELNSVSEVAEELKKAGLLPGDESGPKKFLAYVGSSSGNLCGQAHYPPLQFGTAGLQESAKTAAVFLFSDEGCGARVFGEPGSPSWSEAIAMHELIHTEGVVPLGAPHGCLTPGESLPTHICTPGLAVAEIAGVEVDPERVDVMFPFSTLPLSDNVLDRDNDDYFDHALPLRDLADSPWLVRR